MDNIHQLTALEIIQHIQKKALSAKEVMLAHLEQIEKINPVVNALTAPST